jgi:hypothetical protein
VAVAREKTDLLDRLLSRLRSHNLLHLATAPAFFGEPNDIAVSVADIVRLLERRTPPPINAGLEALAQVLEPF